MRAAIDGAVKIRFLTYPDVIRNFGDDRAADRAMGTDILAACDRGTRLRRRAGGRLAYGAERQSAETGKSAGKEARSAQEGPAVQSTFGGAEGRDARTVSTELL